MTKDYCNATSPYVYLRSTYGPHIQHPVTGSLQNKCKRNRIDIGLVIYEIGRHSELLIYVTVTNVLTSVNGFCYLHQRGQCNRRCMSVCLLPTLCKNFRPDLREIFREGWQLAIKYIIKFWWRPGLRIRIATLVRRALAEVCTVPMLLVAFNSLWKPRGKAFRTRV